MSTKKDKIVKIQARYLNGDLFKTLEERNVKEWTMDKVISELKAKLEDDTLAHQGEIRLWNPNTRTQIAKGKLGVTS